MVPPPVIRRTLVLARARTAMVMKTNPPTSAGARTIAAASSRPSAPSPAT